MVPSCGFGLILFGFGFESREKRIQILVATLKKIGFWSGPYKTRNEKIERD